MPTITSFSRLLTLALMVALAATASAADGADRPRVRLITNLGEITIELEPERAPKTVDNFLTYLRTGAYDHTIFHRVVGGFVIQGGGYRPTLRAVPQRPPIRNESDNGLSNRTGTIAMARTSNPHSATSQFYINLRDNPALDYHAGAKPSPWGYAVFGRVVEGMGVVRKIGAVPTGPRGPFPEQVPLIDVVLEKAQLIPPTTAQ